MLYTEGGAAAAPDGLERGEYGWFQFSPSRGRVVRRPEPGSVEPGGAAAVPLPQVLAIQLVHESRRLEILLEPSGGEEADEESGSGDSGETDHPLEVSALRLIEWGRASATPIESAAGSVGLDATDSSGTHWEAKGAGDTTGDSGQGARAVEARGRKERGEKPSRAHVARLGAPSLVPPAPPPSAELLASVSQTARQFVTCLRSPCGESEGGGADAGDGAAWKRTAGAGGKAGVGGAGESAAATEAADVGIWLSEMVLYPASHHVSTEKVRFISSHVNARQASSHSTPRGHTPPVPRAPLGITCHTSSPRPNRKE
eukprot:scaffold8489_cov123-Isochrysis_galbana.AAC.1